MKLSELLFNCAKNVIQNDDKSFSYENFMSGLTDEMPEYTTFLKNAFFPINLAISRLSELDKIHHKCKEIEINTDGTVNLDEDVKEIVNIAQFYGNKYYRLEFRELALNKIVIMSTYYSYNKLPIFVEYKEDIPSFSERDIPISDINGESVGDDVNLKDYGINDSMCNYIIEFTKGTLLEQIEPELANMHITRAEQYFANIQQTKIILPQTVVQNKYRVGF